MHVPRSLARRRRVVQLFGMQGPLYDGLNSYRRAARTIDASEPLGHGLILDGQEPSAVK